MRLLLRIRHCNPCLQGPFSASRERSIKSPASQICRRISLTAGALAKAGPTRTSAKLAPVGRPPPKASQPTTAAPKYRPSRAPARPKPSSGEDAPPENPTLDKLFRQRRFALVGVGLTSLALGFYVVLLVNSYMKAPTCACEQPHAAGPADETVPPTGRPPSLTRQSAGEFDRDLEWPEWLMGITKLRKRLASQARGHVLEVAMGTGRNLAYYDWSEVVTADDETRERERERTRIRSLLEKSSWAGLRNRASGAGAEGKLLSFTGVDVSGDVLEVARGKLKQYVPGARQMMRRMGSQDVALPSDGGGVVLSYYGGKLRFAQLDALHDLPGPPASEPTGAPGGTPPATAKYDTVLQTFGLCSVSDPVGLVANLARSVKPGTGRILLLEHGRGWSSLVNNVLDNNADRHFQRYGCRWNRDIEGIVREAAKSVPGLEVVNLERPYITQAGTMLWIELKVDPGPSQSGSKIA